MFSVMVLRICAALFGWEFMEAAYATDGFLLWLGILVLAFYYIEKEHTG